MARVCICAVLLAVVLHLNTATAQGNKLIVHPDRLKVQDEYIVKLKAGADVDAALERLVRGQGATKVSKFEIGEDFKGFSFKGPAGRVQALVNRVLADDEVTLVEENVILTLDQTITTQTLTSTNLWGLDRIDTRPRSLPGQYNYTTTGSSVCVFVVDTGIRATHTDLSGRVITPGYVHPDVGTTSNDGNGHGTHCAGTIGGTTYGVAKEVKLVPVKVLSDAGSGTAAALLGGFSFASNKNSAGQWVNLDTECPLRLMSMSLGFGAPVTSVDDALTAAINAGVAAVAAAGNDNMDACNNSPGRAPAAITVGATDQADARASFSNYGTCVDLFAPGVSVLSSYYTSNTATAVLSGTSMATPHVAGAVALLLHLNPTYTPAQLASQIVADATIDVVTNLPTVIVGKGKNRTPTVTSPNKLLYVSSSSL